MSKWTPDSIGDLDGKTIVITGGNSGIGYETAKVLACHGGDIVIACRNLQRAQRAIESIQHTQPGARITAVQLDLADLASVRRCVAELNHRYDHLDVLINNAGVMALPYTKTVDGFEMQLGTNHFGHFALTAQLYPLLKEAAQPRIVTVASNAHKTGRIQFDDINSEERYSEWGAYSQSKLANLLFFHELTRRTTREAPALRSLACHPGYADTKLLNLDPQLSHAWLMNAILRFAGRYVAQTAEAGAWPTLYAATASPLASGSYIGPSGLFELTGKPTLVKTSRTASDPSIAHQLWQLSEEMTGVPFPLSQP